MLNNWHTKVQQISFIYMYKCSLKQGILTSWFSTFPLHPLIMAMVFKSRKMGYNAPVNTHFKTNKQYQRCHRMYLFSNESTIYGNLGWMPVAFLNHLLPKSTLSTAWRSWISAALEMTLKGIPGWPISSSISWTYQQNTSTVNKITTHFHQIWAFNPYNALKHLLQPLIHHYPWYHQAWI